MGLSNEKKCNHVNNDALSQEQLLFDKEMLQLSDNNTTTSEKGSQKLTARGNGVFRHCCSCLYTRRKNASVLFVLLACICSVLGFGFWVGYFIGNIMISNKESSTKIDSAGGATTVTTSTGLDHDSTISSTMSTTDAPNGSVAVDDYNFPTPTATVASPSPSPNLISPEITYIPGNLTKLSNGLLLSEGLQARTIAKSGESVLYHNGRSSGTPFHVLPDAGATFLDEREWNPDGWIYVSNSESKTAGEGGVGSITFDRYGSVIHYHMVLQKTHMNCGGGRTPWNTWVSCEEVELTGKIFQVDPTGARPPEILTLGKDGGRWESFAYDVRDKNAPTFFATEDHNKGCTRRFRPDMTKWDGDEWSLLHGSGIIDFLFVNPNEQRTGGTFEWVSDLEAAKNNARSYYPESEGIDVQDGKMYIVCKKIQQLFIFDLDNMTYRNTSTISGLFDGGPDQMQRIIGSDGGLLYFTEEGGENAGVHARDMHGRFFTIFESPVLSDETTGLSFSPDGKHLYVAYQESGLLYDITREDGYPFNAKSLDVKYHSVSSRVRRLNSQWIGS